MLGINKEYEIYNYESGTPQGGIISPTIANFTLNGLENCIFKAMRKITTSKYDRSKRVKGSRKLLYLHVEVVRFADDFVVTARSKFTIEKIIKPSIQDFLEERGLKLSQEKTRVVNMEQGFSFLGYTFKARKV